MALRYYQAGGAVAPVQGGAPAPEAAPAEAGQGAGDQQNQMMQALQQVIQSQDPNMALQFCNQLGEQLGIAGGGEGEGAGQEQAMPAEGGVQEVPQGKNGMKIPTNGLKNHQKAPDKMPMPKKGSTNGAYMNGGKAKKMTALEKMKAMKDSKTK